MATWQHTRDQLRGIIAVAYTGGSPSDELLLKKDERLVYYVTNTSLIEIRRGPGHWSGKSSGISVPIAPHVRARVGSSRGHYTQGVEQPQAVDSGTMYITTQRAIFRGQRRTVECLFSKLIGVEVGGGIARLPYRIDKSRQVFNTVSISIGGSISGSERPLRSFEVRAPTSLGRFRSNWHNTTHQSRESHRPWTTPATSYFASSVATDNREGCGQGITS